MNEKPLRPSFSCHHSPPPFSVAAVISRIETFWYRRTRLFWKMAVNECRLEYKNDP